LLEILVGIEVQSSRAWGSLDSGSLHSWHMLRLHSLMLVGMQHAPGVLYYSNAAASKGPGASAEDPEQEHEHAGQDQASRDARAEGKNYKYVGSKNREKFIII